MIPDLKVSQSQEIKELVSALAKAQRVMKPAVYNRVNPHFKSRYADFASCMEACRVPLADNGLAVIQSCETIDGKISLITMLAHVSGQWMKSEFPIIPSKMDSQAIGSAMTYAKRYSLCGMIGIVADEEGDDDGEAAMGRNKTESPKVHEANKQKLKETLGEEDMQLVNDYIQVVMKNFSWSEQDTVSKFLQEKDIVQKFNAWKDKRKTK
jgi:hypothetical protein